MNLIILLAALPIYSREVKKNDMNRLLPQEIDGWVSTNQDMIYNLENVFQYLDGGAELYITYGMKQLLNRRYKHPKNADIVVDIFQMNSYKDAFALFTHDYNGNEVNIGRGSKYESGLLIFWKDKYYISILTEEENSSSKKAVISLGKSVADKIKNDPIPFDLNKYFPANKEKFNLIHYINNHNALNLFYFISKDNIFNINYDNDAAIAVYSFNNQILYLLLIHYFNEDDLINSYKNVSSLKMKKDNKMQIIYLNENPFNGVKKVGKFLIAVFNGKRKEDVEKFILSAEKKMRE